jgi:hypothetical protein
MFEDLKAKLEAEKKRLVSLRGYLDLDKKIAELEQLQAKTHESGFWNDNVSAQKVLQDLNNRKEWVDCWAKLHSLAEDTGALIELAEEGNEGEIVTEIDNDLKKLDSEIERLELKNMLGGVDDAKNALLTITPGLAAQSRRIGLRCSCACTHAGVNGTDSKSASPIFWKERVRASRARLSRCSVSMRTVTSKRK